MTEKISSGNKVIDSLLGGGLEKNNINMFYGEAATGKTTLCLLFAAEMASKGKKVLFLDSENGFSIERLSQLRKLNVSKIVENIFVIKLKDFDDQRKQISMLNEVVEKGNFEGIIFDTMGYHYRRALKDAPYRVNKEADNQFCVLKSLADKGVCVLITNQVYANFREKDRVEIVGGEMFRNWSYVLVEIRKLEENKRKALLLKPIKRQKNFQILEGGFTPL